MNLHRAIIIAVQAHEGQIDKGGNPYILHPLSVMLRMQTEETRIVAVLHDVIEDTPLTLDNLRNEGFSEEIIDAVDAMTRRDGETYFDFIKRVRKNGLAKLVKVGDISENLDLSRIPDPGEEDYSRVERYEKALELLQGEEA